MRPSPRAGRDKARMSEISIKPQGSADSHSFFRQPYRALSRGFAHQEVTPDRVRPQQSIYSFPLEINISSIESYLSTARSEQVYRVPLGNVSLTTRWSDLIYR